MIVKLDLSPEQFAKLAEYLVSSINPTAEAVLEENGIDPTPFRQIQFSTCVPSLLSGRFAKILKVVPSPQSAAAAMKVTLEIAEKVSFRATDASWEKCQIPQRYFGGLFTAIELFPE